VQVVLIIERQPQGVEVDGKIPQRHLVLARSLGVFSLLLLLLLPLLVSIDFLKMVLQEERFSLDSLGRVRLLGLLFDMLILLDLDLVHNLVAEA